MSQTVTVRSARAVPVDGKNAIQEVSYRITTENGHFESAERFDLTDLDVNGDGFIDEPELKDLAGFVEKTLKARPGTEGCSNAWDTIAKQIADRAAEDAPEEEVIDYVVPGIGIDDDDEDE